MKKFFYTTIFGFLLGTTLTGIFSPRVISWYFDPPTAIGVSCKEAVVWGINAYQKMLMVGGAVGFALAFLIFLTSALSRKTAPHPAQSEKAVDVTQKLL